MLNPKKTICVMLIAGLSLAFFAGCENEAQSNALLGAAIGTGVGALAGGGSDSLMIGAAAGGGLGYFLGNEADKKNSYVQTQSQFEAMRAEQNSEVVWVTNSNGSRTPVKLTKSGYGYVGPRNDHYASVPTEQQLKLVYGF
jgi:hypothetical protein